MKKVLTLVFAIISFTSLFGQNLDSLTISNWAIGESRVANGHTITRLEGKNDILGMTNIDYQTQEQMIAELKVRAEREMWTEEKKKTVIGVFEKNQFGGIVHLYITRLTIDAGNAENFTMIVKDSTETELFRQTLKSDIPEVPASGDDYWWNYLSITLRKGVKDKFYIYIIDQLNTANPRFKFEVKL